MKLKIRCKSADLIELEKFKDFQGNLKTLTDTGKAKLRKSLETKGFISAIHCWQENGNFWVLDAHQRIKVLKEMKLDGWKIPPLPTEFVEAKNRKEAKEILLLKSSTYAEIDDLGLEDFLKDSQLFEELDRLEEFISIDEFEYLKDIENIEIKEKEFDENIETENECPKCGYKWN